MTYDDYLWDRSGEPDSELRQLEDLLRGYKYEPPRKPIWRRSFIQVFVPLAAAAALILSFTLTHPRKDIAPPPVWKATVDLGAPTVDGTRISSDIVVASGQWLQTDESSRLQLTLGPAGEVFVESGTKLQITSASDAAPHITLKQGMIHVALWSDSDVTISTPSGDAVDRNDEFVLAVDETGHACLSVNTGGVSLRHLNRESIVPAGAVCEAFPDRGVGTPYCESAPDDFRLALETYDFEDHGETALTAVLNEAGPCDLVPLWHLLRRSPASERGEIFDQMAAFEAPPPSVTREGILHLEAGMMQRWWEQIRQHKSCMMCAETHDIGVS